MLLNNLRPLQDMDKARVLLYLLPVLITNISLTLLPIDVQVREVGTLQRLRILLGARLIIKHGLVLRHQVIWDLEVVVVYRRDSLCKLWRWPIDIRLCASSLLAESRIVEVKR